LDGEREDREFMTPKRFDLEFSIFLHRRLQELAFQMTAKSSRAHASVMPKKVAEIKLARKT